MKILFLGDVVPGGVLPYLDYSPLSLEIMGHINNHDLRVATLETPLGDDLPFDSTKMGGRSNIIYSPTSTGTLLLNMGINVVSLANNHIFDLGFEGFLSTKSILKEQGILFTGAGKNIEEALQPVIIDNCNSKIAIIAACSCDMNQVGYVPVATENSFGVAPLDMNRICYHIRQLKKTCDFVVVLPHWGKEYSNFPLKESISLAKTMIKAGADLIIGSHTHSPQPKMIYQGKEIYYSLGNGLFPDFYINTPRPIWYPDSEQTDLKKIPITYDYPFPVTSPLRRVWRDFSRIGMAVSATFEKKKISTSSIFSFLNEKNVLTIKQQRRMKYKLDLIRCFMKLPIYDEGKNYLRYHSLIKRILI